MRCAPPVLCTSLSLDRIDAICLAAYYALINANGDRDSIVLAKNNHTLALMLFNIILLFELFQKFSSDGPCATEMLKHSGKEY